MSFWVYILYSAATDSYYKGQTEDLKDRLRRHNNGFEKSTKRGIPWKLIWKCEKADRSSALNLEKKLKNLSRDRLKEFLQRYQEGAASPDDP